MHGYRLLEEVNKFLAGRREIRPGSLYTILRRMEQRGFLKSEWETSTGRPDRRVYRISDMGIERLKAGRAIVENQLRVLNELAEFYRRTFDEQGD